tara:strand:- start:624 stop:866 length:243 start_codon:yes stop_codon:yes gene_type:complete
MADDRLPNGLEHKYEKIPQSMYQTVRSQVTDRIQMLSGVIDEHNSARAKAMEEINKQLDEAKRDLAYLDDKFISSQPDAT